MYDEETPATSEVHGLAAPATRVTDSPLPSALRAPLAVFVVGYMHSGTTLVQEILNRNSAVFPSTGETKYFERLSLIRSRFPNLNNDVTLTRFLPHLVNSVRHGWSFAQEHHAAPSKSLLPDRELDALFAEARNRRLHEGLLPLVFDYLCRRAGKRCWVEKTPSHVFHLDSIFACLPEARVIEVVRDPRDILASKKTRRLTVWTTNRYRPEQRPRKHLEKAYDPVWDSLSWKSAIRAGEQAKRAFPDSMLTVKYERLVGDPEPQVRQICRFLGLDFEGPMLTASPGIPADPDRVRSGNAGPISTLSVGRWRAVLDPEEVAACHWLTHAQMSVLGYESSAVAANPLTMSRLALRSASDLGGRLFRKARFGGFPFLVNQVVNYGRRLRFLRSP